MARPLRIQFEHAFYHVLNRGLERRVIFKDKDDHEAFLKIILDFWPRFQFSIHSYCLMPNHYHFLIETPKANLSQVMRGVNGVYTQCFNRKYQRVGPLFQGRYKAILVEKEAYSLQLSRYIHLNPIKAKLVRNLEDYQWSSYSAFVGKEKPKAFLETRWLLSQIGAGSKHPGNVFHQFTLEGLKESWDPLKEARYQGILGREAFIEEIKKDRISAEKDPTISRLKEIQKPTDTKDFEKKINLLTNDVVLRRKFLVYALKKYTSLSLKEIGRKAGAISGSAVCQIVNRLESSGKENQTINNLIIKMDELCQM